MAHKGFPRPIGIDQLTDETAMVDDGNMYVREANNVDIDREGNLNRRAGYTQLLAGNGFHSMYAAQRGWLMVCQKDQLGSFDTDDNTFTAITSMGAAYLTSFAEENGNLYVSNSGFHCMFRPGENTARTIGVTLPLLIPTFTANTTTGTLPAGKYALTYTLLDDLGEESGTGPLVEVELDEQGSIDGAGFSVLAGYSWRIYMTSADGEELYQAAEFDADTTSFSVLQHEEGRQPRTWQLEPAPFGHLIRAHNSRLLIASTNGLYFTEAFRPHLHNPGHGFVPTTGFTTMVESVGEGVFVGDSRGVKFYAGKDPEQWQVKDASPDRAVFGTSVSVPGSHFGGELNQFDEVAVWLSSSGYQIGLPTGEVVRANAERVQLPDYVQGCSAFVTREGRKQLVTPVDSNVLADASVALDSSIGGI